MTTLIVSDLHLGAGRDPTTGLYSPLEDFFADRDFAAFLDHYSGHYSGDTTHADHGDLHTSPVATTSTPVLSEAEGPPHSHTPTLVLNGDTFNLSETDEPPTGDFADVATQQLYRIAAGHPVSFTALRDWLTAGNQIVILYGNHDWELALPQVQQTLRQLLTPRRLADSLTRRLTFAHFHHDPDLRLYVEHGDKYCLPRRPGHPPLNFWRARYFSPLIKQRIPQISNIYESHWLSHVIASNPLALLPIASYIPGYLAADKPVPPRYSASEHKTLHTINISIIIGGWDRARKIGWRGVSLSIAGLLLRSLSAILPAGALIAFLSGRIILGVTLTLAVGILQALAAAAAHRAETTFATDLPRAAAADIAPSVARAGVRTLVFGHSHRPDKARFGEVDYFNAGAWIHIIDPLAHVPPPTQTYVHVDDQGHARLLQWTDNGPREPIIVGQVANLSNRRDQ